MAAPGPTDTARDVLDRTADLCVLEATRDRGPSGSDRGESMAWWGWLLLVLWPLLAVAFAVFLGLALRESDQREWIRYGRAERRRQPRPPRREDARPGRSDVR